MKKLVIMLAFVCCIIIPGTVFAEDYVNNNGVVISGEMYDNLLKIYSEEHISILTTEQYNRIVDMDLDYDNVQSTVEYVKTEYNQVTGETVNTVVSKEEYDAYIEPIQSRATVIETSYKRIALNLSRSSGNYAFGSFNAIWKIMPAVRSFDVIGFRTSNLQVINGTQQGQQIYKLNGTTNVVEYSFNGTNIKNFDNGFGISMNLLNSDVTYLECTIDTTMAISATPGVLFASYQHAIQDVSLATSQNYSIGVGLGDVFVFNNNIGRKYDGMEGTYDYVTL